MSGVSQYSTVHRCESPPHRSLPTGDTPIADVNFKHLTIAPDRTIILKDQTRPTGSALQGTMAGLKQGNSHLVAVHPDTLEVLDDIPLMWAWNCDVRRQDDLCSLVVTATHRPSSTDLTCS